MLFMEHYNVYNPCSVVAYVVCVWYRFRCVLVDCGL